MDLVGLAKHNPIIAAIDILKADVLSYGWYLTQSAPNNCN